MTRISKLIMICSWIFFTGCSVEPQEIHFGEDACVFCKMNIVDDQHAAELVSSKGKAYKFDAIECMLNYMNRQAIEHESMAYILVNDFNQPGMLIDAQEATYIKSKAIPSPMGGYLSALSVQGDAADLKAAKGGVLLTWEELCKNYEVN